MFVFSRLLLVSYYFHLGYVVMTARTKSSNQIPHVCRLLINQGPLASQIL